MEINLTSEDRLRVSTNNKRMFADVGSAPLQESLTIEFYGFQKQQIRCKSKTYKMFIFNLDQPIDDFDFGYWNDAEIVWKSY